MELNNNGIIKAGESVIDGYKVQIVVVYNVNEQATSANATITRKDGETEKRVGYASWSAGRTSYNFVENIDKDAVVNILDEIATTFSNL